MRAIVVNPNVPSRLAITTVGAPQPLPNQAIVRVAAISLNRGEIRRAQSAEAGWRIGWDLAGTIEQVAADGSGPPVGTRVVGFLPEGAWAERVAVPTHALAALPAGMSFAVAATLPVAGLTALMTLQKGGLLLGKRVLITGASGGVGYFACQLAKAAGATVVGHVRRSERVSFVRATGVDQVVEGETPEMAAQYGDYDLILDSVGDRVLPVALSLLAPGGVCVTFGSTAGRESLVNVGNFYGKGGLQLYGFILFHEVLQQPAAVGLQRLVKLVEQGKLKPHIDLEADWQQVGEVAQQLQNRAYVGKAILHLD
jgi:NADPH:quinone reductase-like Zn-dependent oxidoreductase